MEIWRPVVGFESDYEVSSLGRARRLSRGKKLTAESAELAKSMLDSGSTLHAVAKAVGVSHTTAFMIRKGITWNGNAKYRPLNADEGSDFYLYYWFCIAGKPKRFAAHRVIWAAFHGPIPDGLEINHKNLDRQDNRLENLELMTRTENIRHAIAIYRSEGGHNKGGRYHAQKVAQRERRAA